MLLRVSCDQCEFLLLNSQPKHVRPFSGGTLSAVKGIVALNLVDRSEFLFVNVDHILVEYILHNAESLCTCYDILLNEVFLVVGCQFSKEKARSLFAIEVESVASVNNVARFILSYRLKRIRHF